MTILGYDVRIYFLLFMIYAVAGWIMEVTCKLIQYKRFINRGFLVGPYCPIYGTGAILITFLLNRYTNDPFVLFIMAILVCGTLEYLTSYFMEKLFSARWWDYSNKKFNINGRVCLRNTLCFGILAIVLVYFLNPFILTYIEKITEPFLSILFYTLLVVYIIDNIISYSIINNFSSTIKKSNYDNTEEVTKYVKDVFLKKNYLSKRLIYAYPNFQTRVRRKLAKIKEALGE